MWDPQRDIVYGSEEVKKKFGVSPDQILDLWPSWVTVRTMFPVFPAWDKRPRPR